MNVWIIVSLILFVVVIYLLYKQGQRVRDLALSAKQAEREWTLKVALEKTYRLPDVEAKELEAVEARLEEIKAGAAADAEKEEQMRAAIMGLYEKKGKKLP